jgi:hypothetical protein
MAEKRKSVNEENYSSSCGMFYGPGPAWLLGAELRLVHYTGTPKFTCQFDWETVQRSFTGQEVCREMQNHERQQVAWSALVLLTVSASIQCMRAYHAALLRFSGCKGYRQYER